MARWHDRRTGAAGGSAVPAGAAPEPGIDIAVSHGHGYRAREPAQHHFYPMLEHDMAKKAGMRDAVLVMLDKCHLVRETIPGGAVYLPPS